MNKPAKYTAINSAVCKNASLLGPQYSRIMGQMWGLMLHPLALIFGGLQMMNSLKLSVQGYIVQLLFILSSQPSVSNGANAKTSVVRKLNVLAVLTC